MVSKPETLLVLPSLQSPSLVPTLFTKNPTPKRQRLMRRSYCPSEHLKITPPPPPTADSFQHLGVKNTVSAIPIPIPTPSPSPASSTHPSATSQSARAPCPHPHWRVHPPAPLYHKRFMLDPRQNAVTACSERCVAQSRRPRGGPFPLPSLCPSHPHSHLSPVPPSPASHQALRFKFPLQ